MLTKFGAGDHRRPLIEQVGQRAQQSGLALSAFAEQHEIVPGDQRALKLRQNCVFESEDSGPDVISGSQRSQQVLPDLLLDAALAVAGCAQLAEGAGKGFGAGTGCSHTPTLDGRRVTTKRVPLTDA